jgi:uncharacterized protein DUF2341
VPAEETFAFIVGWVVMPIDRALALTGLLTIATACQTENIAHDSNSGSGETSTGASGASMTSETVAPDDGVPCPVGAEGCACTQGGSCDPGLVCDDGTCIAAGSTSSMSTTAADTSGSGTSDATTTTDASTSTDTGGQVDLDDWTKRRQIVVQNTTDDDLTDLEVRIELPWDADHDPLLADLRFTDESGTVLLPHWNEEFTAPISSFIWVRLPQLDANGLTTIYVWYGNPMAADSSDPQATFHWFEGFDGNDIGAGWIANGDYVVSDGTLTIDTGAVYSTIPIVTQPGVIVEVRRDLVGDQTGGDVALQLHEAQGWVPGNWTSCGLGDSGYAANSMGVPSALGSFGWFVEWIGMGSGPDGTRWIAEHNVQNQFDPDPFAGDFYMILGYIYGSEGDGVDCRDIEFDTIFVRNFVASEPDFVVGAEEDV